MVEVLGFSLPMWLCIVVPMVYIWYKWQTRNFDYFKRRGIPHPKPIPFIGNIVTILKKGVMKYDDDLHQKYGKVIGTFIGGKPAFYISDLDILKQIFVKEFHHFQNRMPMEGLRIFPTRAMLTQLGSDHWKHVRNTLTPTFSGGKLRRMTEGINHCAKTLISHLDRKAENNEVLDARASFENFTMDVIARAAFGIDIDSQSGGDDRQFIQYGQKVAKAFGSVFDLKLLLFLLCPRVLKFFNISIFTRDGVDFFCGVINEALKRRGEKDKTSKDFLQLMVDAHTDDPKASDVSEDGDVRKSKSGIIYSTKGLTHEEILAQAFTFFLAGFGGPAGTLSFLSYNLATNPDCQEKLYQEIIQVMDGTTEPDYDIIKRMPYLQMCLEETLRLYPAGIRTDRVSSADVVINGLTIEKDTIIQIPIWTIHHDPHIWPKPFKFIPERFTAEEKAARHPMAWLPFGQGPRNCIGMRLALMEIKFAVIHILLKFKLVTCEETQIPLVLKKINMDPEKRIKIQLEKR